MDPRFPREPHGNRMPTPGLALALSALLWGVIFVLAANAWAEPERYYQAIWCLEQGGRLEVVMPDGSRCDCETATHAVEFDFGKKWAESIGQALNYARQTPGKRAGVVLIVGHGEGHYVERVKAVAAHYGLPLDVWTVER